MAASSHLVLSVISPSIIVTLDGTSFSNSFLFLTITFISYPLNSNFRNITFPILPVAPFYLLLLIFE